MNIMLIDIIVDEVVKLKTMNFSEKQISALKESMTGIALSAYELGQTGKLKKYTISKNEWEWDDESEYY